jgi:hypothetical protein
MSQVLGYTVKSVTIDSEGNGLTVYAGRPASVNDNLMIALAGELAERIRFQRCDFFEQMTWIDDEREVSRLVADLPVETQARYIRRCRKEVRALLRQHWGDVETLVGELLRLEEVSEV